MTDTYPSAVPQSILEAPTIGKVFSERTRLTPERKAYRQYDAATQSWTSSAYRDIAVEAGRWQQAFRRQGLAAGDRVVLMLANSRDWVTFDLAAQGLGLVTVPIYNDDQPDNIAYIIQQTEARILVVGGKSQWSRLARVKDQLDPLKRIVSITRIDLADGPEDARLESAQDCLYGLQGEYEAIDVDPNSPASIVYTSGTTGHPKGVVLSHRNLLTNAIAATRCAPLTEDEVFLSFLPLSHTLERSAGFLMPLLLGAEVAFARSIQQLAQDLQEVQPTVLISVPRIYERVYARIQAGLKNKSSFARWLFTTTTKIGWARFEHEQGYGRWRASFLVHPLLDRLVGAKVRARLGGRLKFAVCGGAPLPMQLAEFFIGLGMPIFHGYGLTEASPVVAVNRPNDNRPASIGTPIPDVEVRLGDDDELLTRSPCVMLGYWKNPEATAAVIDADGWLHTGDVARIDADGHIFITGRIKDILVLSNGEKVPPADMEMAITLDPLFDQALVIGEGRPFLAALVVVDPDAWRALAAELKIDPESDEELRGRFVERTVLSRIAKALHHFPGYARIRRVTVLRHPWTIDDGLLTPTLKLKRARIVEHHAAAIEAMYAAYDGSDAHD
ncbi:MAG: AMP-dependent synthetase/ligase [Thioalkalivibrionaceae bacterium]